MNQLRFILPTVVFLCWVAACKPKEEEVTPDVTATNPDWTAESHGNDVSPNYAVVFPQEAVNALEITIRKTQWDSIRTDMKAKFGRDFGAGGGSPGGGGIGGGGNGGVPTFGTGEPNYFAVTMKFNEKTWTNLGFRLKGNSSLSSIWRSGIYKLPFRLKMDEFEDQFPAIKNQRLYGFQELSMSPGYGDNSLIREKVAADIFREAGVPAAKTAFYKVYIDFGEGKKYCGIYTMVEVIDDTMVKDQFTDDPEAKGNIYKPESTFQSFVQSQFEKKNNKEEANYGDVQAFITALNATNRTSAASIWRDNLEKTFNVDHYLKYLAVNNTMVSWDVYGAMAHNYYLYNSPTKKLIWIPWDHNEAMKTSGRNAVSLAMTEVAKTWPLLRYVAEDAVYYAQYKQYVAAFTNNVFTAAKMGTLFDKYHNLIAPYVNGSEVEQKPYSNLTSTAAFTSELATLKTHVNTRNQAVATFLK
ncbi:CotH kinase family protein [Emticicia agri]|uniref:Spore coat protein CotH n=1 Tax=Emticicia agri TaxID=2492393 RepID=A0A4Q5M2U9_9BACT|nr:CotH kinase family protein [Emticicia agri]RYU96592.1 spore coat protein CotH [Emticicia agri]